MECLSGQGRENEAAKGEAGKSGGEEGEEDGEEGGSPQKNVRGYTPP